MNTKLIKLVIGSLMAAMTCIATMILQIRIPFGGYIHPGDAFVFLSGIILGPFFGGLAAGLGSILADLLTGYPHYALATFIIKTLAAMVAYISYKHLRSRSIIFAGILASIVVTVGYFIFDSFLYGFAASLVGVPFNIAQNIFSIILIYFLLPLFRRTPMINDMMMDHKANR